ncbi:uncharacterized protein BDZ99DRAFT_573011 [Mytilinidion resinicola]|uniref:BZIP domain-containing protein n=1 Tax=Mytilinidion resinicola TaxID=574789 RepID=A0A6A6YGH5_9PEZI|nr:uncharacterized protein BDZ99DRAFT_573011 [Mytilinidion resinicola]KAF2807114.1 hypothetical protein BDZ99DRAFT_573011 [Mytilinidion resinicola]
MNHKNGSRGRVEERQPKKHKPKRKVSELDEIAAKRRRTQACRAQRAFRQRKEDTITSLNAQIAGLNKTIEGLNACFLTLTDELVASGWLEHNPQVTKAVQRAIERFITIVRVSHVPQEDDQTVSDCHSSGSMTTGSLAPEISLDRPHDTGTSEREETVVQSVRNAAPWEAANQPSDFQSFPCELVPAHNNTVNFMSQLRIPGSMDPPNPTFAQRLHFQAIRAGLRLVCTAEDRSMEFYRVFNRVLDFHTREGLRALLNKILNDNFNQLLQPPLESDVDRSWSGGLSCAWLNASDVARYFRTIGMDFDGSQGIVTVKMHPGSFLARLLNAQGLPATGLITLCGDGLEESPHQQPPHDLACLSSTAHHYFTATAQDASCFGIFANNIAYTTRSHNTSHISIDVSRLIHEIVLRTRCLDRYPAFNRNDLDDALARAVIETHKLK